MKTFTPQILSMAMLLALPTWVSAQVFKGDLTLSTQAQVDAFNYTEVTGNLTIGYQFGTTSSDITNLQPLSKLTKVGASLVIRNNNLLQDLQGLEHLVTSQVRVERNSKLRSLNGLKNSISLVELIIDHNDQLQYLQGLEDLTSLDRLWIYDNDQLQNLQGLKNLDFVNDLGIRDNDRLTSLQGLENIQPYIHGGLSIFENPQLNDCCAIARLASGAIRTKTIRDNGSNCNSVEVIQENCPQTITHFTLVDAASNKNIFELYKYENSVVINVLEVGNQLNIRANTSPKVVGSVVFELDGKVFNIENVLPYALAGDEPPREYRSWTPTLGRHTLTATPYKRKNGKGKKGFPLTVEFIIADNDENQMARTTPAVSPKT